MEAARRVRDCLPDPPTPTSSALPPGTRSTRLIRDRCSNTYLQHNRHRYQKCDRYFTPTKRFTKDVNPDLTRRSPYVHFESER